MSRFSVLFFCLLFTSAVFAVDLKPYENSRITPEQWQQYHDRVASELARTRRVYEKEFLEAFSDRKSRVSLIFTLPGHAAHPAWIARRSVHQDGNIVIDVSGFYAGDETAFNELFAQYYASGGQAQQPFKQ